MTETIAPGTVAPVWFDNHCHLTTIKDDASGVVAAAGEAGVGRLITVGCNLADSQAALEISRGFDSVWATAGVHPHDASDGVDGLEELLSDPKVVAVGEAGFDYHYNHSSPFEQRSAFEAQIDMAHRHNLALVIHTREAWSETFEVLDSVGVPDRTVFHCFTGGPAEAEQCLGRGAYVSFSGIVTFKGAPEVREAASLVPDNRILIETDSPYLAPVPYRGKANQPAFVDEIGRFLADHRSIDAQEFAALTWDNAGTLFGV